MGAPKLAEEPAQAPRPMRKRFVAGAADGSYLRVEEVEETDGFVAACSERAARPREPRGIGKATWDKALDSAARRLDSAIRGEPDAWDGAAPREYVAAYALMHERVYGVEPLELTPAARLRAAGAAKRMLDQRLGGEPARMGRFLLWSWKREQGREEWRRANHREGGRVGWQLQFGGALLSDYLIEARRRAG